MIKVDKDLVIVVYNSSAYYHYNRNELKKVLFEGYENNSSVNKDVFEQMSLQDIDKNIKQVLVGNDIIDNLVDDKPNKGYYTCRVKTNNGCFDVKIPSYFFDKI